MAIATWSVDLHNSIDIDAELPTVDFVLMQESRVTMSDMTARGGVGSVWGKKENVGRAKRADTTRRHAATIYKRSGADCLLINAYMPMQAAPMRTRGLDA